MRQFWFVSFTDCIALCSPRILMVMELMEGGELFELVRTKRRFTEKEAVIFSKQVMLLTLPIGNIWSSSFLKTCLFCYYSE